MHPLVSISLGSVFIFISAREMAERKKGFWWEPPRRQAGRTGAGICASFALGSECNPNKE